MNGVVLRLYADNPGITNPDQPPPRAGMFLTRYEPERAAGAGAAWWSADLADAMVFATFGAALECWRTIPTNRPVRLDGRPNRPLTALTVEAVAVEDGALNEGRRWQ